MKRIVTFGLVCLFAWACVSMALPLNITITAVAPPIMIPPNGGSFQYQIIVQNPNPTTKNFRIWNKVKDAAGVMYLVFGPSIGYSVPSGGTWGPYIWTQNISGSMSVGVLTFISYVGIPYPIWDDRDSFTIIKLAVSDNGPWISESYVTGDLNFDETSVAAPTKFALGGNYPNPFNPTTNINYTLATAGNVKLTVFDATGREVATLVNGFRDAGSHQVTFDASKLATGVYLYQLHSGSQVATGKMVFMK